MRACASVYMRACGSVCVCVLHNISGEILRWIASKVMIGQKPVILLVCVCVTALSPLGLYLQNFIRSPALSPRRSRRLTILDKNSSCKSTLGLRCHFDILPSRASMLTVTIPPIIAQEEPSESELERKSRPVPGLKRLSVVDGRRRSHVGDLALQLRPRFACMARKHDQKRSVLQSSVESGIEGDRRRQVAHVPLTGGGPG